jgi:hypothetical protein
MYEQELEKRLIEIRLALNISEEQVQKIADDCYKAAITTGRPNHQFVLDALDRVFEMVYLGKSFDQITAWVETLPR